MAIPLGARPAAVKLARSSFPTIAGVVAALVLVATIQTLRRNEPTIPVHSLPLVSSGPVIEPITDGRRWLHGSVPIVPRASISLRAQLVQKVPRLPAMGTGVAALASYEYVLAWQEWLPQSGSSGSYQSRSLKIHTIPGAGHIRPLLNQLLVGDMIALRGYLLTTEGSNEHEQQGTELQQHKPELLDSEIMWVDEAGRAQ